MTDRKPRNMKRKLLIIGTVLVAGGALAAGYFVYQQYISAPAQDVLISESIRNDAVKYVRELNMAGNDDIAVAYIEYVKAGHPDAAQKFFDDKVRTEPDTQKKVDLLLQQQRLALSVDLKDQALEAAKRAAELLPTGDAYAAVAQVYIARQDYVNAEIYWQKAYDTVSALDSTDKEQTLEYYQQGRDTAHQMSEYLKDQR